MVDLVNVSGFDWDSGNLEKCRGHGVSREEIEALFRSTPLVTPDIAHSAQETRYLAIGRADGGRAIFVAFTLRAAGSETLIRPISARAMHAKEIARYEKALPPADH